jgi:hypothetical protein
MIVQGTDQEPWMTEDLLPGYILSALDHICPHLPAAWAFVASNDSDALRRREASRFGIAADRVIDVVLWLSEQVEKPDTISWPDVFFSRETAQQFAERYLLPNRDWHIIGLGIESRYVAQISHQIGAQRAGCWAAIDYDREIASGGEPQGFELLGLDGAGSGHSWLCNGIEQTFYKATGVRPNAQGFLATAQESAQCLEFITANPECAEPVPWWPWLVVRYPWGLRSGLKRLV